MVDPGVLADPGLMEAFGPAGMVGGFVLSVLVPMLLRHGMKQGKIAARLEAIEKDAVERTARIEKRLDEIDKEHKASAKARKRIYDRLHEIEVRLARAGINGDHK